jgi:peptidyl-prolyl cis-trans isomerase B (cyclophilin B)
MIRHLVLVLLGSTPFAGYAAAQPPAANEPAKVNARPASKPAKAEPFDGADIATLAGRCVSLHSEAGLIELEMYPEQAPESVRNFLNLVSLGYLDTTTFSRVVRGFVIQGGDLFSRQEKVTYEIGTRARKTIPDEPNEILHERGVLSMARPDEPNQASTHFFILVSDSSTLDGKFAAFGRVIKGMDVVDAINKAPVADEKPEKPVRITKAITAACAPKASK